MTRLSSARIRGFSLIELMIVVVVIGILAAVAYPSYIEHVAKSRRHDLKAQLAAAQQWLERGYSETYSYPLNTGNGVTFQAQAFHVSPAGSASPAYNLAIDVTAAGAQTYTLTATRAGPMANDHCGDPSINNTGQLSVDNFDTDKHADEAAAIADCWR